MAIKVTINGGGEESRSIEVGVKSTVKVNIIDNSSFKHVFELKVREALNGDFLIFDHSDIDIVVLKEQKKVVAFAKNILTEKVYGAESRLFEFLRTKGIISYDSIQGGNVYGSLEGQILESKSMDPMESTLVNIAEWVKEEMPYLKSEEGYEKMIDDYFTEPTEEDSTKLGKVPEKAKKGSMVNMGLFSPYYNSMSQF
jgi:hypothetical protein